MENIEHGTFPNCNEWAVDETGECTSCGHIDSNYEGDIK